MKSKKLGRSELLSWINKTVESEYLKVEDLSDGVGFCQIIEAFFKGISHELNTLKFNAINDIEQKQKNLSIFNNVNGGNDNGNINNNDDLDQKLDKYNLFFKLLQEDLARYISNNKNISNEIIDAEEEKDYYLEKLQTIYDLCNEEKKKSKNEDKQKICQDIMDIISNVPDDFK